MALAVGAKERLACCTLGVGWICVCEWTWIKLRTNTLDSAGCVETFVGERLGERWNAARLVL